MNTTVITITTEDGHTFRTPLIRQGLAMPLCVVAPCLGRHADTLSAPLSILAQPRRYRLIVR